MKKVLALILGGIIVLIFAVVGATLYTSIPLRLLAFGAGKLGIQIEGPVGNLANGYKFARVSYSDEFTDLKIEGISFQYSGPREWLAKKNVIYDEILIDSADLNIKKHRPSKGTASSSPNTNPTPMPSSTTAVADERENHFPEEWVKFKSKWREGKIIRKFMIKNLKLANMKVTAPELPMPIELTEFKITNFSVVPERGILEEMKIVSTFFDLSLAGLEVDEKGIRIKSPASVVVKTTAWKGLKKNIPLTLSAEFDFATNDITADLSAFDEHLQVNLTSPGFLLKLEARDLSLFDYLEGGPAITHLNLRTPAAGAMTYLIGATPFQGDFMIGENRFTIPIITPGASPIGNMNALQANAGATFRGVYDFGHFHYEAFVKPNLSAFVGQETPWVQIRTNQKIEFTDLVAQLYFRKPFAQLVDGEKQVHAQVSPKYSMGPPFLPVYRPSAPAPVPVRKSATRLRTYPAR